MSYVEFLDSKRQMGGDHGFDPTWMPDALFDFQRSLVEWACRKGRAAIFADTGLGKTITQLAWAENVVRKTGGKVLVVAPLAVSRQTVHEGKKFGIEVVRSQDGKPAGPITITNYQRLERFDSRDFVGVVADESSALKCFESQTRKLVIEFMRRLPYRLCCTATAAPNDYDELGNHSEALGEMGHLDMLSRFFVNDQNNRIASRSTRFTVKARWRLKGHAEEPFWRWVCSWARALRYPSDLGFADDRFILPPLVEHEHLVKAKVLKSGWIFDVPAVGIREQREERRRTLVERCDKIVELVSQHDKSLVWCDLNAEGTRLAETIPGAVEVKGSDSDEYKEEMLMAFAEGQIPILVTKAKIGCHGLNLQKCAHVTFFPSHSFEQFYQGVRRCWRFGQTRPVVVDIVTTEGEIAVLDNLKRKAEQAKEMFARLVNHMQSALKIERKDGQFPVATEVPKWL